MSHPASHDHSAAHENSPGIKIPASFNITDHFLYVPALAHPGRPAILGEPAPVSYGELASLTRRVSLALSREGMAPNERVLIVLPDSAEFIAAFLGVVAIGAVAVPVNPMARQADYAHYLRDSGAKLVIVHEIAVREFASAAQSFRSSSIVVVGEVAPGEKSGAPLGCLRWNKWLPASAEYKATRHTLATDTAFFLYTSGSGGTPKAAVHQHKDMLVTSQTFAHGILGITREDRTYSVSKLFFAYGLGNGMYFPFSAGASTILDPERPKPEHTAAILVTHRPTIFFAVPTFYSALLRAAEQ